MNQINLIASAVRAGDESARKGEEQNPFDGRDEVLRKAFHLGWSSVQVISGLQFYPVETMLRIVDRGHAFHADSEAVTAAGAE
ncbi:TPA: hypothetical protein ACYLN4_000595 [Burkholderia lata]